MRHDLREDQIKVPSRSVRALIRLMCLQDAGMIPETEWEEFMSQKIPTGIGREDLQDSVEYLADIVDHYKVTKLENSLVKDLAYAVRFIFPFPKVFLFSKEFSVALRLLL